MVFTIHPALVFYLQLKSLYVLYQSKPYILRNPMLYTSPRFRSEEAARSQVEPLQNDPRWLSGQLVQNTERASFAKGFAVAQTLYPVIGVSKNL